MTALRAVETSEPVTTPPPRTNGWVVYSILGRGFDEPQGIYVARPGTDPKRIVGAAGDGARGFCPSFSPDGSMLSYTEGHGPGQPPGVVKIVVTAVDEFAVPVGSAQRIEVPSRGGGRGLCAQWSPDGTALAYSDSGLWVVPIGGGDARRLVEGPIHGTLAWSPDGTTIAGTSSGYVVLISVDDGEMRAVQAGTYGGSVSWSPDGRAVAVAVKDGSDGGSDRDIAVIDIERGTSRVLPLGPGVTGNEPDWSPDGQQIAFVDEGSIHLVDPDTGYLDSLPGVAVPDPSPLEIHAVDWSPDGQRLLAFGTDYQPELAYCLVSIAADGLGDPVLISPVTIAFYYTGPSDFDWQGVPT
ncbi:MAG TPA: hypothetical protein VE032_06280 [Actinomycetota bacterium]|nr:hypothetical protein [Actinomycetota bacterium]